MTDPRRAPAPSPAPGPVPSQLLRGGSAKGGPQAPVPDLEADHLPCGRPTEALLDLVLDGRAGEPTDERDDHQRTCVHCRALAAEADQLWDPVRIEASRLESPPPDLLQAVTARVRALGRDPVHLVIPGSRGATRINTDVLRQIAERAAGGVPGVAVALARRAHAAADVHPDDEGMDVDMGVGVSGRHTVLDLAVVTVYGAAIPAVAARAREAVRAALAAMTTATDVHVDIYVDDITAP